MKNGFAPASLALALLLAAVTPAFAQAPHMNYQGVLRDSADNPLDGTYDMVFRFYGPVGQEFLIDEHLATGTGAVTVTNGLFNVALGGGAVSDGSSPDTYTRLHEVFRDYAEVWLEIQIGADGEPGTEVLSPRVRFQSSAYSFETSYLDGLGSSQFLRSDDDNFYTGSIFQIDTGAHMHVMGFLDVDGDFNMAGTVTKATTDHVANFNADLLDGNDSSAFAAAVHGHVGGDITGPVADANDAEMLDGHDSTYFLDTSSVAQTKVGPLTANSASLPGTYGLTGRGPAGGGLFTDSDGSGEARVGYGDAGIEAFGNGTGGYFEDTDASAFTYVAVQNIGIDARGNQAGGYFEDADDGAYAYIGHGDRGITAHGTEAGGYFQDDDNLGRAFVGYGARGIHALGNEAGGYFQDNDSAAWAYVGYGTTGIEARGSTRGGYFLDSNSSGVAHVGHGDHGISAYGDNAGGYFEDTDGTGHAYVGRGDVGIWGYGTYAGGRFEDSNNTGQAYVGIGNEGINALGSTRGGTFNDTNESGVAYVAEGNRGIWAKGNFAGGTFSHPDNTTFWSDVATPTHKITGTGLDGFVQNHPFDENKVVYYTAPEGDEAAVYTRGTARLVGGEATVALGETFKWVANPDLGLTAHLTPHGDCMGLYVASLGTEELVVRELGGGTSDVVFDYIVYGLRIGFEEFAVVNTKPREAPLPVPEVFATTYAANPGLRKYNALERYKTMTADVRGVAADEIGMSGAAELRGAILAAGRQQIGRVDPEQERAGHLGFDPGLTLDDPQPASDPTGETETITTVETTEPSLERETIVETPSPYPTFPVSEPVEPGDLLTLDPERPGTLVRATAAQDPGIVGIAADLPLETEGELRVALVETNYAIVKVDAGYGEIRPGDLLTSSFTPGHAMRATEIVPGTVIGKALEPLETGTGLIRVLVMPR
jgi:hypothetical protein